jgi:hypothetical protein
MLKAIGRWRERRRERRLRRLEKQVTAHETLRDYQRPSAPKGHGPTGGAA